MNTTAKILTLKKQTPYQTNEIDGAAYEAKIWKNNSAVSKDELRDRALKVLNEMEEIWEMDHGNVELRDRFHLLRYYLERSFS